MTLQKQHNSNFKPCTSSQELCPNLFLADFYSWFWTLFKLSENRKKYLSEPQIKLNYYKWSYLTTKANAKVFHCFSNKQINFESSKQKFQKSSFFDFESGYESGYGYARSINNIKNGTFDIFHPNTFKTHILVEFCGNWTSIADFRGLWNLKKSENCRFFDFFAQNPANCSQNNNVIKIIFIGPKTRKNYLAKKQYSNL